MNVFLLFGYCEARRVFLSIILIFFLLFKWTTFNSLPLPLFSMKSTQVGLLFKSKLKNYPKLFHIEEFATIQLSEHKKDHTFLYFDYTGLYTCLLYHGFKTELDTPMHIKFEIKFKKKQNEYSSWCFW